MKKLNDFEQSLQFTSDKLTEVLAENKKLCEEITCVKKQNAELLQENQKLKTQVTEIKEEVIQLQQYSRRLNIQIDNLPEFPEENVQETVNKIVETLEIDVGKNIIAVHRVPTIKKDKIKPVIIQFNTMDAKEKFLKTAKSKRLTANIINPSFENLPVYVNEHLCSELKKLLYDCKKFKKENNYKFVWVKSGKIFIRENEQSRVLRIKNLSDLPNVPK